ncbi:helix-turn-helix transcriptional regulator, partial [Salmonella enterica subsp. enterica serovar Montevideo]
PAETRGEILRAYNESERLIKEAERERITAISRTTWWRLERSGEVPRRKRVGGSTVWLLSDLLAWMQK